MQSVDNSIIYKGLLDAGEYLVSVNIPGTDTAHLMIQGVKHLLRDNLRNGKFHRVITHTGGELSILADDKTNRIFSREHLFKLDATMVNLEQSIVDILSAHTYINGQTFLLDSTGKWVPYNDPSSDVEKICADFADLRDANGRIVLDAQRTEYIPEKFVY